jgi:hypothetical protein
VRYVPRQAVSTRRDVDLVDFAAERRRVEHGSDAQDVGRIRHVGLELLRRRDDRACAGVGGGRGRYGATRAPGRTWPFRRGAVVWTRPATTGPVRQSEGGQHRPRSPTRTRPDARTPSSRPGRSCARSAAPAEPPPSSRPFRPSSWPADQSGKVSWPPTGCSIGTLIPWPAPQFALGAGESFDVSGPHCMTRCCPPTLRTE